MASIEKRTSPRGKITYRARVKARGVNKSATFDTLRDAKAWAAATESDALANKYGAEYAASRHTVGDLIQRYLRHVLINKTDNQATIAGQRRQLAWWENQLGTVALADLTPGMISTAKDELAGAEFSVRKPSTVVAYLAVFSHVLNLAVKEWGWLRSNPMVKVSKPRLPRGRSRYLTDREMLALLDACRAETRKPLYLIVLFALCTGARKGEILGLRRKDVDVVRRVAVAYDTKNGDNRQLYLCEFLCNELLDHMARRSHSRLLFSTRTGAALNIEVEWRRALDAAGIEDFRFHDLRHTNASYLAMNGASPSDIAEALGHKSYDMVKRYSHLSTTHVGNVVRGMNEKLIGQLQGGQRA